MLDDLEGNLTSATSSSDIPREVLIAGVPTSVLREWQSNGVIVPIHGAEDPGDLSVAAVTVTHDPQEMILVDSGAGLHVEKNGVRFPDYECIGKPTITLRAANGSPMIIDEMGHSEGLGWIAYCSNTASSLLSVPQLTKQGYVVIFDLERVTIKDVTTERFITGPISSSQKYHVNRSDLYRLRDEVRLLSASSATVSYSDNSVQLQNTSNTSYTQTLSSAVSGSHSDAALDEPDLNETRPIHEITRRIDLSPEEVRRAKELRYLHTCIGHPSDVMLTHQLENGLILGTTLCGRDVANAYKLLGPCLICQAGKTRQRSRYLDEQKVPPAKIGEKVYVDLHPLQNKSIGGITNLLISYDKYSGMFHAVKLINKTTLHLAKGFQTLFSHYRRFGHEIRCIHSDSEPNLVALQEWMFARTINIQYSPPGEHNRPLERHINTLGQRVLCLQAQSVVELPPQLEAVTWLTAVGHLNNTCTKRWPNTTPRVLFEGMKIDLSKQRLLPFGTIASVRNFGGTADLSKRKIAIVLGPSSRSYQSTEVYVSKGNKILVRSDKDIDVLEILPDKLPWKHKLGSTMYSVPGKKVQRKKKAVSHSSDKSNQENAAKQLLTDVTIPESNSAREGEIAYSDDQESSDESDMPEDSDTERPNRTLDEGGRVTAQTCQEGDTCHSDDKPGEENSELSEQMTNTDSYSETHSRRDKAIPNDKNSNDSSGIPMSDMELPDVKRTKKREPSHMLNAETGNEKKRKTGDNTVTDRTHPTRREKAKQKELATPNEPQPTRRSMRKITPKEYDQYVRVVSLRADETLMIFNLSMKKSMKGDRVTETLEAVYGEVSTLIQYQVGTCIRYHDIPADKQDNIITCFMFIKHKEKPDGSYDKTKARLVGDGSKQAEHMYDLVSSSTVALSSVFLLLNIATYYKCRVTTFDIKGAFLHAKFKETDEVTYIRIPKEVADVWVKVDPSAAEYRAKNGTLILELNKFIYGLKQSSLKFQELLTETLESMGYTRLREDRCLFRKLKGSAFSLLSTHVDDILQVTNHQGYFLELRDGLIERFGIELTVNENADSYLGMSIHQTECRTYLRLSQRGLAEKVVKNLPRIEGDRHQYWSPASDDIFDSQPIDNSTRLPEKERKEFLSVLMTLMYLARLTRPDILLAVTHLASRAHCATGKDRAHLNRVVWYLDRTLDLGIYLHCTDLSLHCHCDASHLSHGILESGRGHTGYIVSMGKDHSYLHGRSGKQKIATNSSTEAEIVALVEAMKMCEWLRNVLTETGVTQLSPVTVYEDNQSSMVMINTLTSPNNKSRHFIGRVGYLHDLVVAGMMLMVYLATALMTADALTKPQHGTQFKRHTVSMMGLHWFELFKDQLKAEQARKVKTTTDAELSPP